MNKISVLKPKLSDENVEKIIKNEHTWFLGLVPPRSFQIDEIEDVFVPYLMTGVCYYKKINQKRRCYVFSNLDLGFKKGVIDINNLEFQEMGAPEDIPPIIIDEEKYAAEISHYCKFDLLVKNYRKYIDWNTEILEIRKIYRMKRIVRYTVNGKRKMKEIYLDSMILK